MKKLLSIFLSVLCLFVGVCLVGCNQEKSTVEFSSYMIGSLIGQEEKTEEDELVERLKSSNALYAYKIDKQETSTTQIVYVWNNLLRRELRLDIIQIYNAVPDKDKSVTIYVNAGSTVKIDNKNIEFAPSSDLSFAVLRAIFPEESTVNAKEFRDIFREMAIRLETLEQFGDTEVIAIQTVTEGQLLLSNTDNKEVKLVMSLDEEHNEHTYEWVGYEGGHQKVYTCGCPSPDIAELHRDNDENAYCDVCGYYVGGESIDEKAFFDIISDLEKTGIQRIETAKYAGSVAPNIRKPIEYKTSTLATDIETVYTWLKSLQGTLTKIADKEAQLDGVGTKIFTIYTSQDYFTISDVGRNYLKIAGAFYEQEGKTPEIVGETVTYKFESYYDEAELYINSEKVKDYTFDFEELVCIEKEFETSGNPYRLVASIGSLYLYDEKHFIRNDIQYEIIGEVDFSKIFEEFTYQPSIISLSAEIESQFDLTGKKYWWHSGTNADFADDSILICFQKTTTYPELSVEDFMYENAESISYIFLRPTGGQYENAEKYTQIAEITLKEKGRDKVIEAVQYFERISIIVAAEPNYLWSADGSPDPINANG